MKNAGKIFEEDFKKSIPEYCLLIRIPDPPQAFEQNSNTKFSRKNVCDYYCFHSKSRIFYALELKSTKNKYITYEDVMLDEPPNKMIHKHQILGLLNYTKYDNIVAGFVFNFRDEQKDMERTYFQNIKDFLLMSKQINKFSFNEIDLLMYGGIKIAGDKKRTRYRWNLDKFFMWDHINNLNVEHTEKGE